MARWRALLPSRRWWRRSRCGDHWRPRRPGRRRRDRIGWRLLRAATARLLRRSATRLLCGAAARVLRLWLLNDQPRGITPMRMLSNHLAFVAVAGLLMLPGAAFAQSSPSPGTQVTTPPPSASTTSPMAGHPAAGKNAEERVENRIKELHAQLHITPAEEPQWNQFAEVMRENAREMDQTLMQRAAEVST